MRILVYGAGVQGCELAHRLLQNKKNVVTMLARGEWKERIDQKGLTIVDFGAVVRAAAGVGIVQQVGASSSATGRSAAPRWIGWPPSTRWPRTTATTSFS